MPDPLTGLTQFSGLGRAHTRAAALIDIRASHPLVQRHRMHTEVLGDLLDRDTFATITSHPDHIVTELLGVRLRHSYILPDRRRQARSDVTNPCSSPG